MKTGKGLMTIEIDLKKAYDRISWNFMRETLEKIKLPPNWVPNIMHRVESARMSVLWNNKQIKWFKPTRGIIQGDLISPHLLVIFLERQPNNSAVN